MQWASCSPDGCGSISEFLSDSGGVSKMDVDSESLKDGFFTVESDRLKTVGGAAGTFV